MSEYEFLVQFDPGPDPLARGAELSALEVVWGLRLGSFTPGTRLCDQASSSQHTVRRKGGRLYLDPPCERIANYAIILQPGEAD